MKKLSNYTALKMAVRYAHREAKGFTGRNNDPTGQYMASVLAYYTALCDFDLVEIL
jgi:hypothetical protein